MAEHVAEYLPELALGVLDAPTSARVHQHLAQCQSCSAWLAELKADCPSPANECPTPPAEMVGARLATLSLRSALSPFPRVYLHRFRDKRVGDLARFTGRLSELFGLDRERAARALARAEGDSHWTPGPDEGLEMLAVRTALEGAATILVRARPGAVFRRHRHAGDEITVILQGALESNGVSYWRGDQLIQRAGSIHSLVALPGPACICAVRLHGELEFC